jgi:hypothetical protein
MPQTSLSITIVLTLLCSASTVVRLRSPGLYYRLTPHPSRLTESPCPLVPVNSAASPNDFGFSILRLRSVQVWDFRLFDHRITLSALAKRFGGIVNPICLAVFRLITISNLAGNSVGRSAGFAPFSILSTCMGIRLYTSSRLGP